MFSEVISISLSIHSSFLQAFNYVGGYAIGRGVVFGSL